MYWFRKETCSILCKFLPSIKWMGVALVTQHVVDACQRGLGKVVLATVGLP